MNSLVDIVQMMVTVMEVMKQGSDDGDVEGEVIEMMVVVGHGEGGRTRNGDDRMMLVMA